MEIREVLARNLRKLRQARRLSQEELAYRAEIDRTYVSALERCVYAASVDVVDRLAHVLGVEAADLLRKPTRGRKNKESPISTMLERVALVTPDNEALTEQAPREKPEPKHSSARTDSRKSAKSPIRKGAKPARRKT